MPAKKKRKFPKYLMKVNGKRRFLNLKEAAEAYDSLFDRASFGRYVMKSDFRVRLFCRKDKLKIRKVADKLSTHE